MPKSPAAIQVEGQRRPVQAEKTVPRSPEAQTECSGVKVDSGPAGDSPFQTTTCLCGTGDDFLAVKSRPTDVPLSKVDVRLGRDQREGGDHFGDTTLDRAFLRHGSALPHLKLPSDQSRNGKRQGLREPTRWRSYGNSFSYALALLEKIGFHDQHRSPEPENSRHSTGEITRLPFHNRARRYDGIGDGVFCDGDQRNITRKATALF